MKKLIIAGLFCLAPSLALATNPTSCQHSQQQQQYHCTVDGSIYTIEGASSESEAISTAVAYAEQKQSQSQSSTNVNGNSNSNDNSSSAVNSVNIEGNPKHTTSLSAGLGINVDIPIGRGIQGASCRDTVRLAREMGQETVALQIFLECPHVRKLNLKVNPGDKG